MKKILLLVMLLSAMSAIAQDVIVKRDGSTILSKVIEIGTSDVKFKKSSNQDGPTYTILKKEIQAINYVNQYLFMGVGVPFARNSALFTKNTKKCRIFAPQISQRKGNFLMKDGAFSDSPD